MKTNFLYLIVVFLLVGCAENKTAVTVLNLQEYITQNSSLQLDEVIACSASDKQNASTSYVFYYPIIGATDIRYFETDSLVANKSDFSLYTQKDLEIQDVFGGKLQRFVRSNNTKEAWGVVSYKTNGKLHKSNPIRLKQSSKPTEWTDDVNINQDISTQPIFTWKDGKVKENTIYFSVINDANKQFMSGVYTYEKRFQYYKLDNVVLNINTAIPPALKVDKTYHYLMMGVSEDNWVNLVIQKSFTVK